MSKKLFSYGAMLLLVCLQFIKINNQAKEIETLKGAVANGRTISTSSVREHLGDTKTKNEVSEKTKAEFISSTELAFTKGYPVEDLLEIFRSMDMANSPAYCAKYFSYVAEWAYQKLPKDKKSQPWFDFAYKWTKVDPEKAKAFYASMNSRDLTAHDFDRALKFYEIDQDYTKHLGNVFSTKTNNGDYEEKMELGRHIVTLAYEKEGLALREKLVALEKKTFAAERGGTTAPMSDFYSLVWADPNVDALKVIQELFENGEIDDTESSIALMSGYRESRDTFLEWFQKTAPSLGAGRSSDDVIMWYISSVRPEDKRWLMESPTFRPFHELAVSKTEVSGGSVSMTKAQ